MFASLLLVSLGVAFGAEPSSPDPSAGPGAAAGLSLDEVVRRAVERSDEAAMVRARSDIAQADAGAALASVLPQVSAFGSYTHFDVEVAIPNFLEPGGSDIVIQPQDQVAVGVSGSQVIFSGGAFARVAATRDAAKSASATLEGALGDVRLHAVALFVQARSAVEVRAAAAEALETAERHAKLAENALAVGAATELDLDRARLAARDAQRRLIDAERSAADALGQLRILLDADGPVAVADLPVLDAALPPEAEAVAIALDHRPEARAAKLDLDAARAGRWVVVGDWAPTVAASGQWRYSNNTGFSGNPDSWQIGVSATLPILDGGLRFADARRAEARVAAAEAALHRATLAAEEDARAALRAVRAAQESLAVARDQEEIAARAYTLAERQYEVGAATSLDSEDARSALLRARVGRIAAEGAVVMARWQLDRVLGRADG